MPPDPSEIEATGKKSATKTKAAPSAGGRKLPVAALAGLLAVLVLAAGGWFVWNRFMNKPAADPAATESIFARASSLAGAGKYDQAASH